jgi:hypothetical protein
MNEKSRASSQVKVDLRNNCKTTNRQDRTRHVILNTVSFSYLHTSRCCKTQRLFAVYTSRSQYHGKPNQRSCLFANSKRRLTKGFPSCKSNQISKRHASPGLFNAVPHAPMLSIMYTTFSRRRRARRWETNRERSLFQVSSLTTFLPGLPPVLALFLSLRGSPACSRFTCVCPVRSNLISDFDS